MLINSDKGKFESINLGLNPMVPKHILDALGEYSLLAMGYSSPNPPVAAVITDMDDRILSIGSTQKVGSNHAERDAYEKCGDLSKTHHKIYISLEPCSHFGSTPPCVDLLIKNKPKKVYLGLRDPNPLVRERDSIRLLKENSIEVIFSKEIEEIAKEFLTGFLRRIINRKPRIFIKAALSKEGFYKSALAKNGRLSDEGSDNISQFIRQSVDAIIVGPNTVYIDSPQLNFRGIKIQKITEEIGNIYFRYLKNFLSNNELISKINHRNNQPFRFYCITNKYFPKAIFFKKLSVLEKEKTIFILLDNVEDDKLKLLKSLTTHDLLFSQNFESIPDLVFSNFTLNTVLVEGGNFLYTQFGSILDEDDYIFEIHSDKNLENGITPNYNNPRIKIKEIISIKNDKWIIKEI